MGNTAHGICQSQTGWPNRKIRNVQSYAIAMQFGNDFWVNWVFDLWKKIKLLQKEIQSLILNCITCTKFAQPFPEFTIKSNVKERFQELKLIEEKNKHPHFHIQNCATVGQ